MTSERKIKELETRISELESQLKGDTQTLVQSQPSPSQAELQFQNAAFDEAQRIASIGHWRLDLVKNELLWSDQVFRLFEIDKDKFAASYEAFLEAIHPDDRDAVNSAYTGSLEDKKAYAITHRLLFPEGKIKWVREHCITQFDPKGNPLYSLGTVQDVTQEEYLKIELDQAKTSAEKANAVHLRLLVELEQKNEDLQLMAHVVSSAREAILVTDYSNKIIEVNSAFEEISGYSKDEILGKNPSVMSSGNHDKVFYKEMWGSLKSKGFWSGEVWDKRKNGEIYPKALSITKLLLDNVKDTKYIAIFSDISAEKKAAESLRQLAFFDPLTGLANRSFSAQELKIMLKASQQNKECLAVLFIDLDGFKAVNDSMGHEYGDEVLTYVAKKFKKEIGEADLIARHGGDEFVVFVANACLDGGLQKISESLLSVFDQPIMLSNKKEVYLNCSIGISISPNDSNDAQDLIRFADAAMYEAKKAGKGQFHFFSEDIEFKIRRRMELDYKLHRAVENQEFTVFYQPQVNSLTGEVIGVESLVRWLHPEEGLISPNDFIPLAEQTGLIKEIGTFVLKESCRQNKEWQEQAVCELVVSVNCSVRQFEDGTLPSLVREVLAETGLAPKYLKIEITESMLVDNVEEVIVQLQELKDLGVGISMDDFGTGYSSLSVLKTLPITDLKIDRAFVTGIATDQMIAQVIADLSENMKLKTVAEGAEEWSQIQVLDTLGCNTIQGFYYSKPLQAVDFVSFLKGDKLKVITP